MKKLALFFFFAGLMVSKSFGSGGQAKKEQMVQIETEYGTIQIKLFDETPLHRDNFIKLTSEGFYTDLLFHRVIQGFMIQGGDGQSKNAEPGKMLGNGDLGYTIAPEINPKFFHHRGVLAAARQGDQVNPERRSSACQFYILQGKVFRAGELDSMQMGLSEEQKKAYTTVGGYPPLDNKYTIFGEVTEGMEVVDQIAQQPVDQNNRPVKDIKFSITLLK